MYRGFFKYDNTEIINVARTMAYIAAGLRPPDTDFEPPVACDGLAESLGESYRTPVLDEAPWYDLARPETHGFAGVLPLDITGLTGSTAARDTTENIGDGGVTGPVRRTTRTIGVSALLVGESAESVNAGLEWLTTVLHRQCTDTTFGALLQGFKALPQGFDGLEDLDAAPVTAAVTPDDTWRAYGGTWDPATSIYSVPFTDSGVGDTDTLDGGDSTSSGSGTVDGGAPTGGGAGDPLDGGDPGHGTTLAAHLALPENLSCYDHVTVTWTFTPTTGAGVGVQLGAVDAFGRELYRDTEVHTIDTATTVAWEYDEAPWEEWYPAAWVSAPGLQVAATTTHRPFLDPADCVIALRRYLIGASTVEGPVVDSEFADDCDNKLLQVSWTWVVENPYRYTEPVWLVTGLPGASSGAPTDHADGVVGSYLGTLVNSGLRCTAPTTFPSSCAYDPATGTFLPPPAAPIIGTTRPYHTNVNRSLLAIDPGVMPSAGVSALTWTFYNDATAKHDIRVRIWQQDDPDFGTHDECGWTHEFWITYLAPNALMFVDGWGQEVQESCSGVLVDASGVMRGAYGGPFEYPAIECGGRTFITVDLDSTEGALTWDLTYAVQEG